MSYQGDIRLEETIDFKFVTTAAATGAPTVLAGSPVLSAYPGNSTTQLTAGITLTVDFDGVVGLNNCRVVATAANGYATATNYQIVITTGTVGGTSAVGYVVGSFSIENRSALRPATVARNLVVDAAGLADANVVKLGPTGAGTAQTARDVGASVLLSSGTGTGQLSFTSGIAAVNPTQINGSATAAARLALSAARIVTFTVDTAGFTPTNLAFETSTITEATADHYKDRIIIWATGAMTDQQQGITAYSLVSGRGHFTLTAGTEAPANGDTGIIV